MKTWRSWGAPTFSERMEKAQRSLSSPAPIEPLLILLFEFTPLTISAKERECLLSEVISEISIISTINLHASPDLSGKRHAESRWIVPLTYKKPRQSRLWYHFWNACPKKSGVISRAGNIQGFCPRPWRQFDKAYGALLCLVSRLWATNLAGDNRYWNFGVPGICT